MIRIVMNLSDVRWANHAALLTIGDIQTQAADCVPGQSLLKDRVFASSVEFSAGLHRITKLCPVAFPGIAPEEVRIEVVDGRSNDRPLLRPLTDRVLV